MGTSERAREREKERRGRDRGEKDSFRSPRIRRATENSASLRGNNESDVLYRDPENMCSVVVQRAEARVQRHHVPPREYQRLINRHASFSFHDRLRAAHSVPVKIPISVCRLHIAKLIARFLVSRSRPPTTHGPRREKKITRSLDVKWNHTTLIKPRVEKLVGANTIGSGN